MERQDDVQQQMQNQKIEKISSEMQWKLRDLINKIELKGQQWEDWPWLEFFKNGKKEGELSLAGLFTNTDPIQMHELAENSYHIKNDLKYVHEFFAFPTLDFHLNATGEEHLIGQKAIVPFNKELLNQKLKYSHSQ